MLRWVMPATPVTFIMASNHVVEHEDLLIASASSAGPKPEQVVAAAQALGVVWD